MQSRAIESFNKLKIGYVQEKYFIKIDEMSNVIVAKSSANYKMKVGHIVFKPLNYAPNWRCT